MASKVPGVSAPLVVVLMVALAGLGGFWWYASRPQEASGPPALTQEAKDYVRNLKLAGVAMTAKASYSGADLVEVTGSISNNGDKTIDRVELNCVFYSAYGEVVLRERVPIVKQRLKPGETRTFRLPFEGIPSSWNQAMPQMVIAHVLFG